MDRKEFLKISSGTAASIWVNNLYGQSLIKSSHSDFLLHYEEELSSLLILDTEAPLNTTAVRYYIDNILVSELTNEYGKATMTKSLWKTVVDPAWFDSGERKLRAEGDTPHGTITLKEEMIIIPEKKQSKDSISLTGAWQFADAADLPSGFAESEQPKAASLGFDTSKWATVLVPNSLGYVNKKWNRYEGILGIYRRNIFLETLKENEQLSIVLQSCYWSARIFINGKEVGQTKGGYLPDRFDITNAARSGKNEITVVIDNRFDTMGVFKRINAFYWNWGGLLQEVSIERNSNVALIDMCATGNSAGKLQLWFTSANKSGYEKKKNINVEVYGPNKEKILTKNNVSITIPLNGGYLSPVEFQIVHPQLWNLESPNLYTLIVKTDDKILRARTGFRDVTVSGADIFVNDKIIQNLQGFDRHADYPGLGRTQPAKLPYNELKELYDKGFRIFRPAHYPTTTAQLDAADELGMLVIEEINVTGLKGADLATKEVKDFAAQQLTKMILRDKSHPCIIAWSVGNENLTEQDGAEEYIRDTIKLGRSLDATRLFTHVTMRGVKDKTFEYQDFVAQNYYAGWYTKDVNAIVKLLNDIQAYSGNKPILVSEYGAESVVEREGTNMGTEYYQSFVVDQHNKLLANRPHFIGKMYWASSEFWCRPNWTGGNPKPVAPFHVKGLISYTREYYKLAWRVIFAPIRLSFTSLDSSVKNTILGIEIMLNQTEEPVTISQDIMINEVRGKNTNGVLKLLSPDGFKAQTTDFPFSVEANGSTKITINFKGQIPTGSSITEGFIHAVIDEDTEAHPLRLTLIKK
ncbi:MAG: hypothetical protein LBE82_03290 [Chitinophagaceae bacterium]|jgi:beta-glucuronidase|nr:hypothetical protein [Chitinophagaceae bacterium]